MWKEPILANPFLAILIHQCWPINWDGAEGRKFPAFFPSPTTSFALFLLTVCLLVVFWWWLEAPGRQMCTFGVLGLLCEAPAGPVSQKREGPERDEKNRNWAGEGKSKIGRSSEGVRRRGTHNKQSTNLGRLVDAQKGSETITTPPTGTTTTATTTTTNNPLQHRKHAFHCLQIKLSSGPIQSRQTQASACHVGRKGQHVPRKHFRRQRTCVRAHPVDSFCRTETKACRTGQGSNKESARLQMRPWLP